MDIKSKLLSTALLALGSTAAMAGGFSCSSQNVTIPCDTKGWHFLAEADFLQPANDDLEYRRNSSVSPMSHHAVKPSHKFGFRLEGGWHYDNGRDITVSWARFDQDYSDSHNEGTSTVVRYVGAANFETNTVNIELGQMFNVGDNADMRLHFGGQYFSLDHHLMLETFVGDSPSTPANKYPSDFSGFGPRAGIDWFYHLSHGFQFTSHAAMALLVGDIDASLMQRQGETPAWSPYVSKHSRRTIVPHLEGRAGIRYNHKMDQGVLSIEGGWHFAGVYQSVHHLLFATDDNGSRPIQNISNYTNHGPFINVMFASAA